MALKGNVVTKQISTTTSFFLEPKANRVALVLFPSKTASGDYTVSNDPSVAAGGGIYIPTTGQPVILTRDVVGDLFSQPLYAIAGAAPTIVAYIETLEF